MNFPKTPYQGLLALLLIILILPPSQAQEAGPPPCSSLITYRQFSLLITTAPQCFQSSGCSNTSPHPLSMSTSCPATTSPCYPLFNSLRTNWQSPSTTSSCSLSSGCPSDTACRIPGWPILNSTVPCNFSPHEWLFSNSGGCCTDGNDPFELADWMGRLCNGSEWRAPFAYYDGMAREDWKEWRQPWNWTVEQHNTSERRFTRRSCDSATAMFVAFIVDNFVSAGEAAVELFVYWVLCICGIQEAMKDVKSWKKAVVGGFVSGGLYMISNFGTALMWQLRGDGYQDIPRGYVGLLLCARPSVLGFLSLVSILVREKVGEETTPDRVGWADRMRWIDSEEVKRRRRRVGGWIRRFMGVFKRGGRRGYEVTDGDLVDGRAKAQQLLTSFALTIGVSELCLQFSSLYSIWKTMLVGFDRGFYSASALQPFEGGSAAARMYGGALVHCVLCIPSTFVLLGIALFHVQYNVILKLRQEWSRQGRLIAKLDEYYVEKEKRPADAVSSEQRAEDRNMFREQRVLERLIVKRADPGFWKRRWIKVKRAVGRPFRRLGRVLWAICRFKWSEVRPAWRQPDPSDTATDERALRTGKYPRLATFGERIVGLFAKISGRLQERITAAEQPRPVQPGFHRPRHLLGRFLSHWPFRNMIVFTSAWAERQTNHRRQQIEKAEEGPDRDRFNELVGIRVYNMANPPQTPRWRAWLPSARKGIFYATAFFVTMNYLSQWLFWVGYVENAGDRWCPPNQEFNIEKGIWAAVGAVALLVSVLFSSDYQPQQ